MLNSISKNKVFSVLTLILYLTSFTQADTNKLSDFITPTNKDSKVKPKKSQAKEITFGIIKPDAVKNKHTGEIIKLIELNSFDIIGMKKIKLTQKQAQAFYCEHKDKPFFKELVNYMTSGPIVVLALEKINAIQDWRNLMGTTNPEKAPVGTLRAMFGSSITENAVHGSDSPESAKKEFKFFF